MFLKKIQILSLSVSVSMLLATNLCGMKRPRDDFNKDSLILANSEATIQLDQFPVELLQLIVLEVCLSENKDKALENVKSLLLTSKKFQKIIIEEEITDDILKLIFSSYYNIDKKFIERIRGLINNATSNRLCCFWNKAFDLFTVYQDLFAVADDNNYNKLKNVYTDLATDSNPAEVADCFRTPEGLTLLHYFITRKQELIALLFVNDIKANVKSGYSFGITPLHTAAYNNMQRLIKPLIAHGADINAKNNNGSTPLLSLIDHLNVLDFSLIKLLVECGADLNCKDNTGFSVLHKLAMKKEPNLKLLELLKDLKADLNTKASVHGSTPLDIAIFMRNKPFVEKLLTLGADISATDKYGCTSLTYATKLGDDELVKLLIASGANINAPDNAGCTPLHYAVSNNNIETVKLLISKGANVNAVDEVDGLTCAHRAAGNGNEEMLKVIFTSGYNANKPNMFIKDKKGNNFLQYAVLKGHKNLAENWASGLLTNSWRFTLLHDAVFSKDKDAVEYLLANGAILCIDETDSDGCTCLHIASEEGLIDIVKLLILNDADISVTDIEESTSLHLAVANGHKEVVEHLLKAGGKECINETDDSGWTSLHYAAERGYKDIVELLVSYGADITAMTGDGENCLQLAIRKKHQDVVKYFTDPQDMSL